jgi:3-hydroxybutyryl-CoA dehydratase
MSDSPWRSEVNTQAEATVAAPLPQPGDSASFSKTITETDVVLFAGLTGDLNPVHIDAEHAARSRFGGRVAHGMLTAAFISTVLGMKLPGNGTVYLEQTLRFRKPVMIGDTVTATVEVLEVDKRRRARLATRCSNQHGEIVLEGVATVLLPSA